jgi:hypothetical protein
VRIQKNTFEIKFSYVTNDLAETIKNGFYHYTTPRETVNCDSDTLQHEQLKHLIA